MRTKDEQLTEEQIDEICALYKLDVPKLHIAKKFGKHHSTIIYHINKRNKLSGNFIIRQTIPKRAHVPSDTQSKHFNLQRVKCYDDYVQEAEDRKLKLRETCTHTEIVKTFKCGCCGLLKTETVHSETFAKEFML
jgi:IS30 family transposase